MSQNFDNTSNPTTGGASTGATDAGTTRDTSTTGLTTGGAAATAAAPAREGIAGTAQEYGQKIADAATTAATTAKDYLGDKLSVAKDKFGDLQNVDYKQVADDAKQYARQNPGQALLISAAAGFVLGLLLRSTRR